jgi:hypothetical protein
MSTKPLSISTGAEGIALRAMMCKLESSHHQAAGSVTRARHWQAPDVTEWLAVEFCQHEPQIEGHYYCGGAA